MNPESELWTWITGDDGVDKLDWYRPVSYTHLDVYKRQLLGWRYENQYIK